MNEDSGEIIEGGDVVRARLGLPSGDANIGKQHVPKPWTLYVNSTSPNRSIPVGVSALIRVATSATSDKALAKPRTSRKGPPTDDEEDDDDPQVKFLKFQSQFGNNQQLALQGCSTFLKYSKSFRVTKSGGGSSGQWLVVLVDNKSVFRTCDKEES